MPTTSILPGAGFASRCPLTRHTADAPGGRWSKALRANRKRGGDRAPRYKTITCLRRHGLSAIRSNLPKQLED